MLDAHRLRVFHSVLACGSINAAATSLGYTSSAVSQHVSALQRETGLTLLTRVGRGVEPTAAGRTLAASIDPVLTRLAEVESVVADLRAGRSGSLSISYFASVGAAWMPRVVQALVGDFPRLRLDLTVREELPADARDYADIQIVVEPPGYAAPAGLRARHLLADPYVAVLPADHPLAGAGAGGIELARLAGERWIDNDTAHGWCRRNLIEACRAAGFQPAFGVETTDYRTAIAFVDAGIGLTVLPRLGATHLPAGVVAVPVTGPTPVRSIYALLRAAADTPPARLALDVFTRCAAGAAADGTPGGRPASVEGRQRKGHAGGARDERGEVRHSVR